MGQQQCETPHFQEDQEFEEDAVLVPLEERGGAEKISFPLPGILVLLTCTICRAGISVTQRCRNLF